MSKTEMTAKRENEVESCPFCHPDREIIAQNEHTLAIADLYPVSLGHSFDPAKNARRNGLRFAGCVVRRLFHQFWDVKDALETKHRPEGFNVRIKCGIYAGQTVMHAHVHIIPRYKGDVRNRGAGIRHIMAGKGYY